MWRRTEIGSEGKFMRTKVKYVRRRVSKGVEKSVMWGDTKDQLILKNKK